MEQNQEEMLGGHEGTGEKKKKAGTIAKVLFLIYHILVIVIFSAAIVLLLIPNAKLKLLGTPFGKFLAKTQITEEQFQNVFDEEFKKEEIVKNEDLDTSILDQYLNIALFGLDSRDQSLDSTNSDTIMVVSIDRDSKNVKLVSIYRDSYQKIYRTNGAERYNKINSAYALGGAQGAINTLNQNFDLDIQDYVAVNFNGIATIIDLLGGVDVTITEEERTYINGYLTETRQVTGLDADDIYETGLVHLNGLQATAYCRIRYTAVYLEDGTSYNNDFGRTTRQRIVLTQLIQKAKNAGLNQVLAICKELFKEENNIFKTSMTYDEVIELVPIMLEFTLDSTSGYPFTYDDDAIINSASCVVVAGHAYNVTKLHQYLFQNENYEPSQTVWQIDEKLVSLTGVYPQLLEEDATVSRYRKFLEHVYSYQGYAYDDDDNDYRGNYSGNKTHSSNNNYDDDYYDDDDDDYNYNYNHDDGDETENTEWISEEETEQLTEEVTTEEIITTQEETESIHEETTEDNTIAERETTADSSRNEETTAVPSQGNNTIGENNNEQSSR